MSLRGYNEIEECIPRVLCQATSFVMSMHIAFSAVILTWPFKGLIDIWSPRAIRCSVDERQGPRMPPPSLSIGIIVESGRDYYLFPFHRRDSGQSIRYRLHTYIVNTMRCRFLENRDTLCLNLVVPIRRTEYTTSEISRLSYTDIKFWSREIVETFDRDDIEKTENIAKFASTAKIKWDF